MGECSICCYAFTQTQRRKITCLLCKESVCIKCFCSYLLMEESEQKCMLCNDDLPLEFINLQTAISFQQKYKQKLVNQVIIQEEIKLETTQRIIELEREITMLQKRSIALGPYVVKNRDDQLMVEIHTQTRASLIEKSTELAHLSMNAGVAPAKEAKEAKDESTGTFQCPMDNCNGLVSRGKCGICETAVCVKCREIKEDDHECNGETLETIELLMKTTRPCPKCKTRIYKINGCDQMFCTKCHTAFSWRTGKLETQHIHNPHYFEWRRNNANGEIERQPGDNPCLERALSTLSRDNQMKYARLTEEATTIVERIGNQLTENVIDRKRLRFRKDYLKSKKSDAKKQWKNKIAKQITTLNMSRDLMMIVDMFTPALQNVIEAGGSTQDVNAKLNDLTTYMNSQFKQLCKRHGSKAIILLDTRFWIPNMFNAI